MPSLKLNEGNSHYFLLASGARSNARQEAASARAQANELLQQAQAVETHGQEQFQKCMKHIQETLKVTVPDQGVEVRVVEGLVELVWADSSKATKKE